MHIPPKSEIVAAPAARQQENEVSTNANPRIPAAPNPSHEEGTKRFAALLPLNLGLNRQHMTRSRSISAHEGPSKPAISSAPTTITIPRIFQGKRTTLKAYYDNCSRTLAALDIREDDDESELDFISAFLEGINDKKIMGKLITEMQQFRRSLTKSDGSIQILCEWGDILTGMRRAELVVMEKVGQKASGAVGRGRQ